MMRHPEFPTSKAFIVVSACGDTCIGEAFPPSESMCEEERREAADALKQQYDQHGCDASPCWGRHEVVTLGIHNRPWLGDGGHDG
jgi:hypothetical protein